MIGGYDEEEAFCRELISERHARTQGFMIEDRNPKV
jgi:hypothetical protein